MLGRVELADWHMWWKRTGDRELYRLLMLWWDPIDVKDVPEAQDEYTGYAGRLGRMLYEGAGEPELARFLGDAEESMGLTANEQLDALVAEKLRTWYETSTATGSGRPTEPPSPPDPWWWLLVCRTCPADLAAIQRRVWGLSRSGASGPAGARLYRHRTPRYSVVAPHGDSWDAVTWPCDQFDPGRGDFPVLIWPFVGFGGHCVTACELHGELCVVGHDERCQLVVT
jgi:hypothetical protein